MKAPLWWLTVSTIARVAWDDAAERVPAEHIQNDAERATALVCAVLAHARRRGVDVTKVLDAASKALARTGHSGGAP